MSNTLAGGGRTLVLGKCGIGKWIVRRACQCSDCDGYSKF